MCLFEIRELSWRAFRLASIGEAARILIQTGTLSARRLTSDPTLERDLREAGANYVDESIVQDENLISARGLEDIPVFVAQWIRLLAELRVHSTEIRKAA